MAQSVKQNDKQSTMPSSKTGKTEFHIDLQYTNKPPELPFDLKFLYVPIDLRAHVAYKSTSLEEKWTHDLPIEARGSEIDLTDPLTYTAFNRKDWSSALLDADRALLPTSAELGGADKSSRMISKSKPVVPWLRRTVYLGGEGHNKTAGNKLQALEDDVQSALDRELQNMPSLETIKNNIELSFQAAQEPPVHPLDPHLTPVEVYDVYPDYELWSNMYQEVVFDSDPTPSRLKVGKKRKRTVAVDIEDQEYMMQHALLKGFRDATGGSFVAYLAPRKRQRTEDSNTNQASEMEYQWIREYLYEKAHKSELLQDYVFITRDDHISYVPINSTVYLKKTKAVTAEEKAREESKQRTEGEEKEEGEENSQGAPEEAEDDNDDATDGRERVVLTVQSSFSDEEQSNREARLHALLTGASMDVK